MRIAFLTACCEPGQDGVGDYTLLLARGLAARGHEIRVIALNDPHLRTLSQESDPAITRFSAQASWRDRLEAAAEMLHSFKPDLLSLQFLPWGWNRHGFLHLALGGLSKLIRPWPLQIMCHELWLGLGLPAPMKIALWGQIQKGPIRTLFRRFPRAQIMTHTPCYARALSSLGLAPRLLALCGNIPLAACDRQAVRRHILATHFNAEEKGNCLLVTFGNTPDDWAPLEKLSRLQDITGRQGLKLKLLSLGRHGLSKTRMQNLISAVPGLVIKASGPLPSDEISQALQAADWGLTAMPSVLAGKSGGIAAMLDHALPVIATWGDLDLRQAVLNHPKAQLFCRPDEDLAVFLAATQAGHRVPSGPDWHLQSFLESIDA